MGQGPWSVLKLCVLCVVCAMYNAFCPARHNARQMDAASMHPPATNVPPPPPRRNHQAMPQSMHPTAASSHQPQPQTEIQQPAHGQQQHIGHQVSPPAPPAFSDGISPRADLQAIAAVPHDEPEAPENAVAKKKKVAEETAIWAVFDARAMQEISCGSQCHVSRPLKHV